MDALFIGHKTTAGKSVQSPLFGDILFSNDDKVNKFVEQQPTKSGEGANVVGDSLSPFLFLIHVEYIGVSFEIIAKCPTIHDFKVFKMGQVVHVRVLLINFLVWCNIAHITVLGFTDILYKVESNVELCSTVHTVTVCNNWVV